MAATSINIDNTLVAIRDGIIPGKFTDNNTTFTFPTLKYLNNKGKELEWTIAVTLKKGEAVKIENSMLYPVQALPNYTAEIKVTSQQVGGTVRKAKPTIITTGKNIGKVNETNVITQAIRDALGMYNKHLKKVTTDYVDKPPPMLLQWLNSSESSKLTDSDFKSGISVQRKYDGVRYVTFYNDSISKVIQYSRTGSEYYPAEYINKELQQLFNNLPEFKIGEYGITGQEELNIYKKSKPYLDGELYIHGKSLNYISGQARKESDKDENLHYYVFDIFWPHAIQNNIDMVSKYRQKYLKDIFKKQYTFIHKVETYKVKNIEELNLYAEKFVKEGYEGVVARKDNKGYKYSFNNYHSSNVLKIKPVYSEEFKVIDFTQGKGKDSESVIWICEVNDIKDKKDSTFAVVPNMTSDNRKKLFECLSQGNNFKKYIKNALLTIEYSAIAEKTGKPQQPKAIAFRTYEGNKDPIKTLYEKCGII